MGIETDDESAVWTEVASTATPGLYSAAGRRPHLHGDCDEYSTMTRKTTFSAFDKFFGGFDPILDAVPIPGDAASGISGDDIESGPDIDAETEAGADADAEVEEQEGEEEEEEEERDEHQPNAKLESSRAATGNIMSRDDDDDDAASTNIRSWSHSRSQGRRIVFKSYHHSTRSAREDSTDQDDRQDQKPEQNQELDQQEDYSKKERRSGRKSRQLNGKQRLGLFEISISSNEEMTLKDQGSLTDSDDDDDDKDSVVSNDKSFIFDSTDMAQRGRTRAVHVPDHDTTTASAKSILKHRVDSGKFKNRWNQKLQHLQQQQTPRPEEKKVRYKIQVKVDDDATESREVREEEELSCRQTSFEIEIEDDDRQVETIDVEDDLQTTRSIDSKSISTVPPVSVDPKLSTETESQLPLPSPESKLIKKNQRVLSKLLRWTKPLRKFSVKLSPLAENNDEWPSRVQIEEYSYDESSVASEILISQPKVLVEAEKKETKEMGKIGSTEEAITKLLERRNETREASLARLAAATEKTTRDNIVEEQEVDEPPNPISEQPRLESILSALVDDPDELEYLAEDDTCFGVEVRALDMSAINAVV